MADMHFINLLSELLLVEPSAFIKKINSLPTEELRGLAVVSLVFSRNTMESAKAELNSTITMSAMHKTIKELERAQAK